MLFVASAVGLTARVASGQTVPPDPNESAAVETDVDPTRPVFFSVRPEFYGLANGGQQRALTFRFDARVLGSRRFFSGVPGVVVRVEAPVVGVEANGQGSGGMSDAYGQFVIVPYATKKFALVFGNGVVLPTASDTLTGAGKWVVAPMVIPMWRFAKSLFYVKVQNYTSFAGDATRRDLNYLVVTPLLLRSMSGGWWLVLDSDVKTTWTDSGRTNVRTGILLGHRIAPGVGAWVKPETWWGPKPEVRWALRFGLVWYQRRPAGRLTTK